MNQQTKIFHLAYNVTHKLKKNGWDKTEVELPTIEPISLLEAYRFFFNLALCDNYQKKILTKNMHSFCFIDARKNAQKIWPTLYLYMRVD